MIPSAPGVDVMASGTRLTQKTAEASLWLVPAVMRHAMVGPIEDLALLQRVTQEVPALLACEGDHTVTGAKRGVTIGDDDVALMPEGNKD